MESCDIPSFSESASFEALQAEMSSDLYWLRFFVRPCCPAPGVGEAGRMLDRLRAEVEARDDFTASEKGKLLEIIDARETWYPSSGLCKKQM